MLTRLYTLLSLIDEHTLMRYKLDDRIASDIKNEDAVGQTLFQASRNGTGTARKNKNN